MSGTPGYHFKFTNRLDCADLATLAKAGYSRSNDIPRSFIERKGMPSLRLFQDSTLTTKTIATALSFEHDNGNSQTLVLSCVGSNGWKDWVSNFSAFQCSEDEGVSKFVYKDGLQILTELKKATNKALLDSSITKQVICCGHSRGGAIALYLGYLIKKNYPDLNVNVITWASPGFAENDFVEKFNQVFSVKDSVKNYMILLDPIRLVQYFKRLPGPIVFMEEENGYANTWSAIAVSVFRGLIVSLYEALYETLNLKNMKENFKNVSTFDIFTALVTGVGVFVTPGGACVKILKGLVALISTQVLKYFLISSHSVDSYEYSLKGVTKGLYETFSNIIHDLLTNGKFVVDALCGFWNSLKTFPSLISNRMSNMIELALDLIRKWFSGTGMALLRPLGITFVNQ